VCKFIPEVKDYYWVSNKGRVYSERSKKYLSLIQENGEFDYQNVKLRTINNIHKKCRIHRLVKMCFDPIPNPELYDVNHVIGVKFLNELPLLDWATRSENVKHSYDYSIRKQLVGEDIKTSCYSEEMVEIICEGLLKNMSFYKICTDLLKQPYTSQLSGLISSVKNKKTWTYISNKYDFDIKNNQTQTFTDSQSKYILDLYRVNPNLDYNEVLVNLGYDLSQLTKQERKYLVRTIWSIKTGVGYTYIPRD